MKSKLLIAVTLVIAMAMTSCGSMGPSTGTTSIASSSSSANYSAGQNAGMALRNLYTQYKSSGKFDYTNMNNIMSIMQLVAAAQTIKDAGKNTTAYKDFSKGLILGSTNLVTTSTADNVITTLASTLGNVDSSSLQSALSSGASTATNVANVANSVSSIMSLFSK